MAFGFLGDIVEGLGDVILGPKGTRGASIGGAIGGAFGGKTGAVVGSVVGSGLSSSIASGGKGQEAVSSPTASQMPVYAPESALSSGGFPQVYQPRFAGFPRIPNTTRDIATGIGMGEVMDIIPDINITKYFGTSNLCGADTKNKLVSVRQTCDGPCIYVTAKQQRVLRDMMKYLSPAEVAYNAGVTVDELVKLVCTDKPRRRKGISAADMRTATRVQNKIVHNYQKLEAAFKKTTTRRTTTRK